MPEAGIVLRVCCAAVVLRLGVGVGFAMPETPPPDAAPAEQQPDNSTGTNNPQASKPAQAPPLAQVSGSHYMTLQQIIMNNVRYPQRALYAHHQGTVQVQVSFSRDGVIHQVDIVSSSGYPELDAEARNVFDRIVKFPPVPDAAAPQATNFVIKLPIDFRMQP
jgi:periplasmic protein TonB